LTGNAQTADVRGPEPKPAVELPILVDITSACGHDAADFHDSPGNRVEPFFMELSAFVLHYCVTRGQCRFEATLVSRTAFRQPKPLI
jgi:hypothetical protein